MLDLVLEQTPDALRGWFALGLPVSRDARMRLALAAETGSRIDALRRLAARARETGDVDADPGDLISAALLHSVMRYLIARACVLDVSGRLDAALDAAAARAADALDRTVDVFSAHYPPDDGRAGTRRALVELWLLELAEANPAMTRLGWLFRDPGLRVEAPAGEAARAFEAALVEVGAEVDGVPLVELLRRPMKAHPGDLAGQLDFVLSAWPTLLPAAMVEGLLRARDVVAEEHRPRFDGPGPIQPVTFAGAEDELERFTPDRDWMTTVVLAARLTHVWLDQLSRRYDRDITRLDQIPDEELDRLAEWGVTGLWLIGLWARSKASATIKRKMGNPEAIASAYSLHDYAIAEDLGGHAAYETLRDRARARGIRLAADMVPNHVGVDGKWVIEHPERFLQLDRPPYPNYRFTGPDLCEDPGVGVYLEDGYWTHSDAAVVFKRVDHATGEARYIYHGNDGTQMPWNDTAQIDFLDPDAREAVIQAILGVARRFPIIRFDAAMTLARRHIRRLWHPAPGDGGAIPSRAEHGAAPEAFDEAMPAEFWREVVDRVQAEVPDTLLLAEAFWLMEGYFVRTLGMHRVYNSAFMHMLKDEDNAGYRETLANTLAFSPAVLQRFVNFMNNPDEETAVAQFGKGDKYFGVATLLVTLPGLPMIGHGQVEGFGEKYGMEYRRAYIDEPVDLALVERHARQIFPLMRRRHLFSEADHFALYDFVTPEGHIDQNVFAYSNRAGDERAVVLYNNTWQRTRGWFEGSVPINVGLGGETELVTRTLVEALDLAADDTLYAFRDHVGGLSYLRRGAQIAERGLYAELQGYQTQVFLDFRAVAADGAWDALAEALGGAGVPDLEAARRAWVLRPVIDAFDAAVAAALPGGGGGDGPDVTVAAIADAMLYAAADAIEENPSDATDPGVDPWAAFVEQAAPHGLLAHAEPDPSPAPIAPDLPAAADARGVDRAALVLGALLRRLTPQGRIDVRERAVTRCGAEAVGLAEALAEAEPISGDPDTIVAEWAARVAGPAARAWLGVHTHEGVRWYRDERMGALLDAHFAAADAEPGGLVLAEKTLRTHLAATGWRYDAVLDPALSPPPSESV